MSDMDKESLHGAVIRTLGDLFLEEAEDDASRALGWAVISRDLYTGETCAFGIFPTEMEAAVFAEAHNSSVNAGLADDEPGWVVTTLPILPAA